MSGSSAMMAEPSQCGGGVRHECANVAIELVRGPSWLRLTVPLAAS